MPTDPKPRGQAILRSDEELEALSRVTDDDVDNARRFWGENADDDVKGLIEADVDVLDTDGE